MNVFEPAVAAEIAHALEHLNDGHADTVLLLARYASDHPDLVDAELTGVDRAGFLVRARTGAGAPLDLRLHFTKRPETLVAARAELYGFLHKARAAAGDGVPLTSLEAEIAGTRSLATFVSAVERIEDRTPGLREITVRGGLEAFRPIGPDSFLYTLVPRAGDDASVIAPGFRMEDWQRMPESERPAGAYYTVRSWDPERASIRLWFVLHDHGGGVSDWARRAKPGDPLALWGPRRGYAPPPDVRSVLLCGDETALPAIAAILESLGPGVRAQVLLETVDAAHVVKLRDDGDVEVRWLFRGAEEAGTGTHLADAVRELELDAEGFYAFVAGETAQVAALRRHLRGERGLPAERVKATGYWKRGAPH